MCSPGSTLGQLQHNNSCYVCCNLTMQLLLSDNNWILFRNNEYDIHIWQYWINRLVQKILGQKSWILKSLAIFEIGIQFFAYKINFLQKKSFESKVLKRSYFKGSASVLGEEWVDNAQNFQFFSCSRLKKKILWKKRKNDC